ncbi:hypothetical protein KAX22_02500, partial [bacterium]|nr:hypothetical protein [bacterium]
GFIYGLLRGWDLPATMRFASAVAAIKCRHMGGRVGIPTLGHVEDFLTDNPSRQSGRPENGRSD